ncbi:MAG: GGDEF domain-containing protein [Gammaproteobacteria bacterium]|nr:GGDEF domain-containing protein [Gammaproteobacteria bacterium]MDH5619736.1 GGDEF domain-containing protein [Gammaproteobacteria bacterium]
MRRFYSGMDAWRYIVRSNPNRGSVETFLPLILSAAGALGVLPFAIRRFMQQEWTAAVIDTVVVTGFVALGTYVYRTQRVRVASIAIAFLCMSGVVSTVYVNGPAQVYWVFPALMAVFYLVQPREAAIGAVITLAALAPAVLPANSSHESGTIVITVIVTCAFALAFSLITSRQREQLLVLATKDPLTGAGNRRGLEAKLTEVVNAFRRSGLVASLILIDLDHFKRVNDLYGHAVGDQILKRVTEIIDLRIRVTDSLYRIGGEEFVVILEGADLERAVLLAEQLRTLVDANELVPDHEVTISLGVAEIKQGEDGNDWLHRADEALYRAKDAGRNSTSVSS